jgi:hypothetical protein
MCKYHYIISFFNLGWYLEYYLFLFFVISYHLNDCTNIILSFTFTFITNVRWYKITKSKWIIEWIFFELYTLFNNIIMFINSAQCSSEAFYWNVVLEKYKCKKNEEKQRDASIFVHKKLYTIRINRARSKEEMLNIPRKRNN